MQVLDLCKVLIDAGSALCLVEFVQLGEWWQVSWSSRRIKEAIVAAAESLMACH